MKNVAGSEKKWRFPATMAFWWVSYLIMLAVPLLFEAIAYAQSVGTVNTVIYQLQDSSLSEFKTIIDNRIYDSSNILTELSLDDKIRTLQGLDLEDLTPSQRYSIDEIQKRMAKFLIANKAIDEIYLYLDCNAGDAVLSTTKLYRSKHFSILEDDLGLNMPAFVSFIDQTAATGILLSNGGTGGSLFYSYQIAGSGNGNRMVAVVRTNEVFSFVNSLSATTGTELYISGMNGELIGTGGASDAVIEYMDSESGTHMNRPAGSYGKDPYVIASTKSEVSPLSYIMAVPESVIFADVYRMRLLMIVQTVLCIVIGAGLAYYLAKRNYSPIENLLRIFRDRVVGTSMQAGDREELRYFSERLLNLITENEFIKHRLTENDNVIRTSVLREFMHGNRPAKQVGAVSGLNLFALALFRVSDAGELFEKSDGISGDKKEELTLFIISNIMGELLGKEWKYSEAVTIDGMVACLIRFDVDHDSCAALQALLDQAVEIIRFGQDFIRENFSMKIVCGISPLHCGEGELEDAFRECSETVEYKQIVGDEAVSVYRSTEERAGGTLSPGEQIKLIALLRAGELDEARECLMRIIEKAFPPFGRAETVRYRMYNLQEALFYVLGEAQIMEPKRLQQAKAILIGCSTVAQLRTAVTEILGELHKLLSTQKTADDKLSLMLKYIEENYGDPQLNVSTIVDKFELDRYYATKATKKKTGVALLEFIHKVRLEKAKELLQRGDMKIRDIAEQTGFTNAAALARIFRKYEGITTSSYREIAGLLPDEAADELFETEEPYGGTK